jgi:hypothetical protein
VNIFLMNRSEVNARFIDLLYVMLEESRGGPKFTNEMELELDMYRAALERMDMQDALAKLTHKVADYSDQLTAIHGW